MLFVLEDNSNTKQKGPRRVKWFPHPEWSLKEEREVLTLSGSGNELAQALIRGDNVKTCKEERDTFTPRA